MIDQKRLIQFITRSNWVLLALATLFGLTMTSADFARGLIFGGLLVTVNFHLLARTLKKALTPPHLASHRVVIAKYYIRFIISGFIIFVLISGHYVAPLGLVAGLSIVVASMLLATALEVRNLLCKEAT